MSQTGKNWYVLKAVSGKELKVKEYIEAELKHNELLSQYVSRVLVPTEKHTIQRAGKRILKETCASCPTCSVSWADSTIPRR